MAPPVRPAAGPHPTPPIPTPSRTHPPRRSQFRVRRRGDQVKAAATAMAYKVIGRTSGSSELATRLHTMQGDGYKEAVAAAQGGKTRGG